MEERDKRLGGSIRAQEVHLSIEDKLNSALVAIPKQICKPVKKGFTAIGSLLNTLVGKAKAGYKEIREDWQEEYPARELSLEHNMQTNYASLLSTLLLYTGFR